MVLTLIFFFERDVPDNYKILFSQGGGNGMRNKNASCFNLSTTFMFVLRSI